MSAAHIENSTVPLIRNGSRANYDVFKSFL